MAEQDKSESKLLTLRMGTVDDLALITELADPNIIPAKYGGGDFVVNAWPAWFAMDSRYHKNVFAFKTEDEEQKVVGFERCELYGDPDMPDTGWLEGLRIHKDAKGLGVMPQLQEKLLQSVPKCVSNVYLSTASGNERMRGIADKHYTYLGCMVAHQAPTGGFAGAEAEATAAGITCRCLAEADIESSCLFLEQCQRDGQGSALLPARFHCYRTYTRDSMAEKIRSGAVYGAISSSDGEVLALTAQYESEFPNPNVRAHSAVTFGAGEEGQRAAVFMLRTLAGCFGEQFQARVGCGPFDNTSNGDAGGAGDVGVVMTAVMAQAGYERALDSHLRIYRVPQP